MRPAVSSILMDTAMEYGIWVLDVLDCPDLTYDSYGTFGYGSFTTLNRWGGGPPQPPLSTLTSFTWGCLDAFRKVGVLMKTLFDKVTHRRLPSPSNDAGTTECFCHGECGCGLKPFNSSESLHNSLNKNLDAHVRWFSNWVHDLLAAARANIFLESAVGYLRIPAALSSGSKDTVWTRKRYAILQCSAW